MQEVRDTFLHYLADNLPGLNVHPIRQDVNFPDSAFPELDAVNVTFRSLGGDGSIGKQAVVIDLVYQDERQLVAAYVLVRDVLRGSFYTPAFSYAVPASPVALGFNIAWGRNISFTQVAFDGHSCRYSAQFSLTFYTR